ncbi:MAG TPA: hypothetical protein VMT16_05540, partial [Thermoanaerobaculia bacterium]|nr:hypothetical protein [Thermoanaerobaculia bacterium]
MKRLHELNIDFMRHLHVMVAISGVLVLLALTQLLVGRLNMGIDFAGGTQLIVRFLEEPAIDEVRAVLAEAGMGEVQIQRFGEQERNEIIIKTPLLPDRQEGSRDAVVRALESRFGSGDGQPDLNEIGVATLTSLLYESDPDGRRGEGEAAAREHYRAVAESVMEVRSERGLFASW